MIREILDRIWTPRDGGVRDTSADDEPKYPVKVGQQRTYEVYEVEVKYRNGETAVFETYMSRSRDVSSLWKEDHILLHPSVKSAYISLIAPYFTLEERPLSYEVLSRDPIVTHLGTETWQLSYIRTGEGNADYDSDTVELELIESDIDSDAAPTEES